jgi:hypothetical protein
MHSDEVEPSFALLGMTAIVTRGLDWAADA